MDSTGSAARASGDIWLSNNRLAVTVDSRRGAEIRFVGKSDGPNLLFWEDWSTPLRASRSVSYGDAERDWLSEWRGGWQELFPNAGAPGVALGVPLAFHGEASSTPWEVLSVDSASATLRTAVRLPLTLTRQMWLDAERPVLFLEETVHNESALTVPFVWGHHPAFDAMPGSVLDVAAHRVVVPVGYDVAHADLADGESQWPTATGRDGEPVDLRVVPKGPVERVVYLPDVSEGWAALRRPDGAGIALAWDVVAHPHVWVWTEVGGVDFPWYGRSRVLAVEPASSWPNDGLSGALQRGQAHHLAPGASLSSWLTVALIDNVSAPIINVSRGGEVT